MWASDIDLVLSFVSGSESESEGDSGIIESLAPASLVKDDDAAFH